VLSSTLRSAPSLPPDAQEVERHFTVSPARVLIVQPQFSADASKTRLQVAECLALGYLASALRQAEIAVDTLDAHLLGLTTAACVDVVERGHYSIVGISCSAQRAYPEATELARGIKQRLPGVHVVGGGQFLSHVHARVAASEPALDCFVRGEGEHTFVALIRRLAHGQDLNGLPGVTYRHDGAVVANGPAPRLTDLDRLPFPDRSYLPHVLDEVRAGVRYVALLATRGCIYKCTFCSVDRPRAARSPANVVAEMREIQQRWGVDRFRFNDDLLVGATPEMQAWGEELADRIAAELPGLELWGMTRADAVTPRLAGKLRRAGFRSIFVGVESASDGVLARFKKGTTARMNTRAIEVLKAAGITPELGFIMLEPRMTWDDLSSNLGFLKRVGCFTRHNLTNRLNVYHGSPLYGETRPVGDGGDETAAEDLTERYLYDFQDPKVKAFSEVARVRQRQGFAVKCDVADAIARTREVRSDLCRALGPETRTWPAVRALVEHGGRLERHEANEWLALFEDLYDRIDRDEAENVAREESRQRAATMLRVLAREVDELNQHIDRVAQATHP
jgi:anaerobic magnesium-protoporphyrin IX monomethyl ester cyclase